MKATILSKLIFDRLERYSHIHCIAFCFASLLGLSSCSNDDIPEPALSDNEIAFMISDLQSMSDGKTRASLFNDNNVKDPSIGAGNFTVSCYTSDEGKPYFQNKRVWFFNDPLVNRWTILDSNDMPQTYYWPNSTNLNFFAYMPNKAYIGKDGYQTKETYITLGSYTHGSGYTFSCNLPATVSDDTEMQDFIYAYVTDQAKRSDDLKLQFHHPYSLINFMVGVDSYRMTIKSIQLDGLYLSGTYTTASEAPEGTEKGAWKADENAGRKLYTMELNKRIPNEINYNTLLFDGFLTMPQTLDGVKLILNFNRYTDSTGNDDEAQTISVDFSEITKEWEQGKKYTYIFKIGQNKEEIYFNVVVEDWIENGETNIDVE